MWIYKDTYYDSRVMVVNAKGVHVELTLIEHINQQGQDWELIFIDKNVWSDGTCTYRLYWKQIDDNKRFEELQSNPPPRPRDPDPMWY